MRFAQGAGVVTTCKRTVNAHVPAIRKGANKPTLTRFALLSAAKENMKLWNWKTGKSSQRRK